MNVAKKSIVGDTLTFEWADETQSVFDPSMYSEEIQHRAMMAGFGHKLGDAYSGCLGNVDIAKGMQDNVNEGLLAGDWNRKGGGASSGGIWVEAMSEATSEPFAKCLEVWNGMDEATKKTVRAHPDVKVAKARIELERATVKASGDVAPLTI